MPRYWVIAPVESKNSQLFDNVWQFDVANNLISIGWSELGDISKMNREALSDAIASAYPDRAKGLIFNMLWAFYHEITPGDMIVARRGRKTLVAVGKVVRAGFYALGRNPFLAPPGYSHQNFLEVEWQAQPRNKVFPNLIFLMQTLAEISEVQYRNLLEDSTIDSSAEATDPNEFALEKYPEEFIIVQPQVRGPGGGTLMSEDVEIEFETPLEEEVESIDIPTQTRTVYTDGADPEIASLDGKAKRGKLVVQPDFQRHFVWDNKKASRLIESALLSIPIPIIYISEEPDNKEYVIAGQQRLTSFFSFLDGKFPDGADFRLTGLNVFQELNGKKYESLPEKLQDAIQYFKLRTVAFKQDSDPHLKFEIFERLNTGSVQLNDQELRNCIYRGRFNDLLRELSEDPDFTFLLGLKQPNRNRACFEVCSISS